MIFILYLFIFIFGLCIGSFLNVVILRLEKSEKLGGRSYCPQCRHSLIWKDLIPVFSFLFLRGKCRYCNKKISIQYSIIEIVTGLLFLLIFNFSSLAKATGGQAIFNFQDIVALCFMLYVSCSMIVIFAYDLKHYLIPDKILFPAIIITFLYRVFENFAHWNLIGNFIVAVIVATGFFLLIFLISRGRWMGFGDVKLAILIGFLLGFPNIIVALFLAFWLGAIIGLVLMVFRRKGLKSELPFAPFLITGTFLAMFWGGQIIGWYSNFLLF